jgi:hypothetical protein
MIPVLGQKYAIRIKVTSKPKAEYLTDQYFELDLPVAPAVMVGDEILVEGSDMDQYDLEAAICKQLELPPPEPESKGFFKKLLSYQLAVIVR